MGSEPTLPTKLVIDSVKTNSTIPAPLNHQAQSFLQRHSFHTSSGSSTPTSQSSGETSDNCSSNSSTLPKPAGAIYRPPHLRSIRLRAPRSKSPMAGQSPQGVLPPSPPEGEDLPQPPHQHHLHNDVQDDVQDEYHYERSASPPPPPHMMMHYTPYWTPYHYVPMGPHYPHDPVDINRSASPPPYHHGSPPPMYGGSPAYVSSPHSIHGMPPGGSPPGPGFIYVPVPIAPHHPCSYQGPPQQQDSHFSRASSSSTSGTLLKHMGSMNLSDANDDSGANEPPIVGPANSDDGDGTLVKPGRSETRASARIARSHRYGGSYNPNDFTFNLEEAESAGDAARTTIMIRNIPNKYTQTMMLSILEKSGFKGTFDFFYLPVDFRNGCNLGYAFVNFPSVASTCRLYRKFHKKRWDEYNSKKVCEISYGRVQGLESLINHFKVSKFPSPEPEHMPLVYTLDENSGMYVSPLTIFKHLEMYGEPPHVEQDNVDSVDPLDEESCQKSAE